MASRHQPENSSHFIVPEGSSTTRPPLFNGNNYSYWKKRMMYFIQAQNMSAWYVITDGDFIPTRMEQGLGNVVIPQREYTDDILKKLQTNASAINMLHCALTATEYNKVSSCETAQDIWNKLEVTYEGTGKVKQSKVNQLMREYELFEMLDKESISDMNSRFTKIVNDLKSLGKDIEESDRVKKIVRSLPRSWQAKKTAIEEVQDLSYYLYDELIGSLITHEMSLKNHDLRERSEGKRVVLKAESSEESSEDEELAMLTRKFKKAFRKGRGGNYKKPFRSFDKKTPDSGEKFKRDPNKPIVCYGCQQPGHIKPNCPELKKDKKKFKKAMLAAWSDSETSSDPEEKEEQAQICFMAIDEPTSEDVTGETSAPPEATYDSEVNISSEQNIFDSLEELYSMYKYLKRKLDKSEADKFLRFTQVYSDMKVLEEKLCKQFSTPADGSKVKGKEKLPLGSDKPQKKKKPVTPSLLKEIASPPDVGTSESAGIASEDVGPSQKKKKSPRKQRERSKNPPFCKLCKSDGHWLKDCKYHIKNLLQSEISLKPAEEKSNSEGPNKDWVPVTN
ncbi:hypothetical protein M5689_013202 [Euphorbia peplus]|nr:hypothetical protein M5689_013202 [Euphorbia peplus]